MKSFRLKSILGFGLVIVAAFCLFVSLPNKTSALSGNEFPRGHIIDDNIFFNSNAMSAQEIQTFLNAKVPTCDTNHAGSGGNNPPFTCLKDYSESISGRSADAYCGGSVGGGSKSAAQIIYDVSQACGISPRALIVILQKEQSLVTDTWPWNIQYRSATGYGCPDTAACDSTYYGFFNQVYSAARQFQRYYKQSSSFNHRHGETSFVQYNPNSGCGGSNIYMETVATAGLYNYTPYQPNSAALNNLYGTGDSCSAYGNRNFWRLFNDWFGSTRGDSFTIANTVHPDGSLVKNFGEPEVYLIVAGTRYHVPDIDTFNSHGFSWSQVRMATAPDKQLPISGSTLAFRGGTLVRGDSTPQVYSLRCMVTFCVKDHVSSLNVFIAQGMAFMDVYVIAQSRVDSMTSDQTITSTTAHIQDSLVLDTSSGKVYRIDTGSKRWIPSLEVFAANHFFWNRVKTATSSDLALPTGSDVEFPEGALVREHGNPAVYVINQTGGGTYEKRHITAASTFAGLSYKPSDVFVVGSSFIPTATGAVITE